MKDITKEYTNGEVTVVWKPSVCIHSRVCFNNLPEVFNPEQKPWINIAAAATDRIVSQVKQCPSGALSYYFNNEIKDGKTPTVEAHSIVEPTPNGPLLVYGNIVVKEPGGGETKKFKVTAFCRCGASANKPYCDGSHKRIGFTDKP